MISDTFSVATRLGPGPWWRIETPKDPRRVYVKFSDCIQLETERDWAKIMLSDGTWIYLTGWTPDDLEKLIAIVYGRCEDFTTASESDKIRQGY